MNKGIESWKNLVEWAFNFFSVPLLWKTLFAPLQNDRVAGAKYAWYERLVFAVFSRFLGFAARVVCIVLGLALTLLIIIAYPLFLIIPVNLTREMLQKTGSIGFSLSYGKTFFLNRFGHDASVPTDLAIVGKDKALRMILRGLGKDTNHNVLLVGAVGVGKDILIDYLGRMGQSGLSESGIMHHRVVELPIESMNEENIFHALDESRDAGNVILVLKNIDKYVPMYEKLLAYLDSRALAVIATTDPYGYDSVLKAHPEFLAKFEKVDVTAPSATETVQILQNYAGLHGVKLPPQIATEIVRLSGQYIVNQSEPQKSILVLDELRALGRKQITLDDVRQIISDKTNIPLGALSMDEKQVLQNLESEMKSKIIGQDSAAADVAQAMKRLRAGIADPAKPAGSFLFLGPTGVGKTYTAKILAESYFGHKGAMIRFDMSEFALPGSLPVFADRLAAAIDQAPLSLVFFDELEKAHRDIHQLLLQVLDEGQFTRESGRIANFKNAIIIATSNAGSTSVIADPSVTRDYLVQEIIREKIFAPEFLNRFSSIILFLPLSQQSVRQISRLLLDDLAARLQAEKGINIVVDDVLVEAVAQAGFDPYFGARPIHRAIEELVENKIADLIIQGKTEGEIKLM